jgi:hypothetical protein
MENQNTINAIATLSSAIDPLLRAKKTEVIEVIVNKMIELIGKL